MTVADQTVLRCSIWRGGTSKGVFLLENELPPPGPERDRIILRLFGSPDRRQIDGLGGADPLTSKVAIIGPSTKKGADVDYTYGMVSIDEPIVSWKGTCGNISAAVGPFAIDAGLVKAVDGATTVRIHNVNTNTVITATVPVKNGKPVSKGSYRIDGVPNCGAKIDLDYSATAGAVTGKVLPTGHARDTFDVSGLGPVEVSVVDVANPEVFVKARDIGLTGLELPDTLDQKTERVLENIRGLAAERIGLATSAEKARLQSANIPHLVIVSPPDTTDAGNKVEGSALSLVSRVMFMQKMHKAYPGTGSICTAVACLIPGTVANEVAVIGAEALQTIRIGHPSGIIDVEVAISRDAGDHIAVKKAVIGRTARKLLEGHAYLE